MLTLNEHCNPRTVGAVSARSGFDDPNRAGWLALATCCRNQLTGVLCNAAAFERREAKETAGSPAVRRRLPRSLLRHSPARPRQRQQTRVQSRKHEAQQNVLPAPEKKAPGSKPNGTSATKRQEAPVIVPPFDVLRVEPDGSTRLTRVRAARANVEVTDQAIYGCHDNRRQGGRVCCLLDTSRSRRRPSNCAQSHDAGWKNCYFREIATVSVPRGQ